ncbi:MAG: SUMF1/EgtB/PvdO family nonheme iron enzyme [Prolixibacteraceae bacterium]|jgi:sulfatase modifying factor 1|nr:SUMF1/EgtB/PvdO family nonheme iron enzyme [Prolixibacteraceae bacterium]
MKNYKLIIWLLAIIMMASCSQQSGESGELVGSSQSSGSWFEPVPFGMQFIRRGSIRIGPSDEDPTGAIQPTRTISVDAFWMDDTEITNNEYRKYVSWVRDSIARNLLYNSSNPNAQYYGNIDIDGNYIGLNWAEPIDWTDTLSLEPMYIPVNERFFGKREIDARKLFFSYSWIDYQKAAQRSNSYNYETQSYGGGITDRSDFIVTNSINVHPDTLCWIRDFTYSYNEPWTSKYFWHPGFDEYPLVGVSWEQANSFCHWRTKMQNEFFSKVGDATVQDYRLPTEFEWEYAARGGLQNSMYPWGGYYSRNQLGNFMANFKPMRGNYIEDGGLATMKVAEYPPNDYGLFDMAGNVAEWTSTAYDELAMAQISELNPDFKYNAKDNDPPALKRKVIRGGSWKDISLYLQVSSRTFEYQDSTTSFIGFRCVRSSFGNDY